MKLTTCCLALLLPLSILAKEQQENLSNLLELYKKESDLSNITKRESAGFLDLYTRQDLEQMQANTLLDVLKSIPGVFASRSKKNTTRMTKASSGTMPLTAARLYINNHDMSSSTYGSAFMIWGEMPISYIDHIEVYRATSSIEFGNESATLIVRLYTKDATRENGGKIQAITDNYGSYNLNTYYAETLSNNLSYFTYLQGNSIKRKEYHNTYNNKEYDYKSDREEYNFYTHLTYKKWQVELGSYYKKVDDFIGIGKYQTPEDGSQKSQHSYMHITKDFDRNWRIQLSADDIVYDRNFYDENGIVINDPNRPPNKTIQEYTTNFHDTILSAIVEKKIKLGNHKLFMGGFYKYKAFKEDGEFSDYITNYIVKDNYSNSLHLFSLYCEDTYSFDPDTTLMLSLKGDYYKYDTVIKSQENYILRTGIIKNFSNFQAKLFYTDSYIMLAPFQLYSNSIPLKTNNDLHSPLVQIYTGSIKYELKANSIEFIALHSETEDPIDYTQTGYKNIDKKVTFNTYQIRYNYKYDLKNHLTFDIYYGDNSTDVDASPNFGINLRFFNSYQKFDFYNEFIYKEAYENFSKFTSSSTPISIEASLDWTSTIKYHYSKDLAFGLRGENILNDSYRAIYHTKYMQSDAIQTVDRKVLVNMEYTF